MLRHAILAVTAGAALLAASACDSGSGSGTDTAAPAGSTAPAPVVSAEPSISATPDYSADTLAACTKVNEILKDDVNAFATQLGKLVANQEKKTADTPKALAASKAALKNVGTKLKAATAKAQDPAIRTAGAESAAKFQASAADSALFSKIKTQADADRVLDQQMTEWFTPVKGLCSPA